MLHTKFFASKPSGCRVLKKNIFEYFSMYMYFYGSNLEPLARDHPGPWDLHLYKLEEGTRQCYIPDFKHLGQFLIYFYAFLWFEPRPPWRQAILYPGTFI